MGLPAIMPSEGIAPKKNPTTCFSSPAGGSLYAGAERAEFARLAGAALSKPSESPIYRSDLPIYLIYRFNDRLIAPLIGPLIGPMIGPMIDPRIIQLRRKLKLIQNPAPPESNR
jgi:hypothetical protein